MRKNRRGMPSDVRIRASLKKGEHIARYKNNVMLLKWQDKRDVLLFSTIHDDNMVEIEKRGVEKKET